jgi:hypothetical protein
VSAEETTREMRAAVESADVDRFIATLSPQAVLRSPISTFAEFTGEARMRMLARAIFETIEDIRYYEEVGDERTRALFYRGRIGSQTIDEASLLRLDPEGRIAEITLWIRPLPGLTRLAATLGPRLAGRRRRGYRTLVAGAALPLAALTALADRPMIGLVLGRQAAGATREDGEPR